MKDSRKKVAAASAVMAYIRKEEETEVLQRPSAERASGMLNTWGISGRQAQMQLRNLMQLRTFNGFRR